VTIMEKSNYILEMHQISKTYPGTKALDAVDFMLKKGQIHALVGANGAGKSTLMKILSGVIQPDKGSGYIKIDGRNVVFKNPVDAYQNGVSIVFQELNVIPDLSVLENIFLNREIVKFGFYDWKAMRTEAVRIMNELGVFFDLNERVGDLSIALQQMVEIIRAVSAGASILILDEPTSSLTAKETDVLFNIIHQLHKKDVTIIYISHRMDEIYQLCDSVTILRDGKLILTESLCNLSKEDLIKNMIGRSLNEEYPEHKKICGEEVLRVEQLCSGQYFQDISFTLHKGEILGLAGLVGAGRTEVSKAIFGEFPLNSGKVYLESKEVQINSSAKALSYGIAYCTEDRKQEGLLLERSIRENIALSSLERFQNGFGLLNKKSERRVVSEKANSLSIKAFSMEQTTSSLSGGNQQKVCLAKWLLTDPKVLIFDEPTRGIDVGAKADFYKIICDLAERGVSILLISSEEDELIGLSDRIIVMREGRISGELIPTGDCLEEMTKYMFGLEYKRRV
jgi:ribose transport system ATP-binding protein